MATEAPVREQAEALADVLLGEGGRLDSRIKEQIVADVTPKLETMAADLAALREHIAERPPLENAKPDIDPIMSMFMPLGEAKAQGLIDYRIYNPTAVAGTEGYADRFEGFGDFVRGVNRMAYPGANDDRLMFKAALSGEEVELGGALVPEEFRAQLMMLMLEASAIRSRAITVPMGSATISLPYIREETHADGATYGGMVGYWPESGDPIGESEPSFGQVTLTAKLLTILTTLNNTLIQDSAITLQMLIGMLFANTTRWTEERAFMKGNGAGIPQGVLNSPALIKVPKAAAAVTFAQCADIESRLLPQSHASAVWMAHPFHRKDIVTMETAAGGAAWLPSLAAGLPEMFLGKPIIWTEHLPQPAANSNSIGVFDWRFYLIGDRQAMVMSTSEHSRFANNQTQFKSVARIDGQPWIDTALTLDGGGEVSPFVVSGN